MSKSLRDQFSNGVPVENPYPEQIHDWHWKAFQLFYNQNLTHNQIARKMSFRNSHIPDGEHLSVEEKVHYCIGIARRKYKKLLGQERCPCCNGTGLVTPERPEEV